MTFSRPPRAHQVVGGAAAALLLLAWVSTGSFVLAALVVVLVAGTVGLGALLLSWAAREPAEELAERVPEGWPTMPLADLHHAPTPGARVRSALRGLLARPWVRGDGLVRAASAKLASPDALVWTPRGQQVAAPHVWVEWNTDDLAEIATRWPLPVLARELADGYADHVREQGVRRMADRSVLHLLAGADVPHGRVVVTAAFSRPQRDAIVTANAPEETALPGRSRAMAPAPPVRRAGPSPAPRAILPSASATTTYPVATERAWPRAVGTRLLGRRTSGSERSAVS